MSIQEAQLAEDPIDVNKSTQWMTDTMQIYLNSYQLTGPAPLFLYTSSSRLFFRSCSHNYKHSMIAQPCARWIVRQVQGKKSMINSNSIFMSQYKRHANLDRPAIPLCQSSECLQSLCNCWCKASFTTKVGKNKPSQKFLEWETAKKELWVFKNSWVHKFYKLTGVFYPHYRA